MHPALTVFLVSMVPIVEFKVGIPLGVANGLPPFWATVVGILGTLVQVPFNLLFLRLLLNLAGRFRPARRFLVWSRLRARKHRRLIRRYGTAGVAILVGIPIPGTGLFTGTVAGSLIGLDTARLLVGLILGTIVAGGLVGLTAAGVLHVVY